MKNPLSSIYEQMLISEAQNKQDLTNPSKNEVGTLKQDQEAFGEKPDLVDGPDHAKIEKGPSYKISTSSETGVSYTKDTKFKGTAPAKPAEDEEPKETETPEDVVPKDEEKKSSKVEDKSESDEEKETKKDKYNKQQENFTMSAFETLFKKTLTEDLEPTDSVTPEVPETEETSDDVLASDEGAEDTLDDETSEETEESEADLISDLRDLQTKLDSILSKLEGLESEEESEEEGSEDSDEEYSDEEFDSEFSNEEEPTVTKESIDKPKPLSPAKGKQLTSKKNKVGKLNPKGGKAYVGKLKSDPTPKNLTSKVTKSAEVSSSVKKGDFLK